MEVYVLRIAGDYGHRQERVPGQRTHFVSASMRSGFEQLHARPCFNNGQDYPEWSGFGRRTERECGSPAAPVAVSIRVLAFLTDADLPAARIAHLGIRLAGHAADADEVGVPSRTAYQQFSWRNGSGRGSLIRQYRFLAEEGVLQLRSDRHAHVPYGLHGGRDGTPSMNLLWHDGEMRELPGRRRVCLGQRVRPRRRSDGEYLAGRIPLAEPSYRRF
jgi:hypothetical protein